MENKHNIEESYRILFLQACDFYKKRNNINGLEIEFIHNINGKKILDKRFNSVLDYSLDLIKLNEISKPKKEKEIFDSYRTDIINIAFDYQSTTKLNLYKLREWAYKEGLVLNGKKYVRYKRSSGSSREGQCLFILEELYKKMDKWSLCGINPKSKAVKENIVSWEAYRALSLSEIKNIININPEHILVLKDYEHVFYSNGIQVTINDKKLVAEEKQSIQIKNSIWDGEGLLDSSYFVGEYADKGMMLLRNRFFKSCVFNTNLRKWFEDNNITEVNQLNGYTNAKSIDDIKLVVTESSIKYLKFGTLDDWRKNIDSKFGVVKTDKPTHFFDGQMVQTSYQMINTLNLSEEEVSLLLEESFDYLKQIQQDKDVLRFHLFQRAKKHNNLIEIENEDEEDVYLEESYRDDVMLKLLKINDKFHLTKAYKQFRSNLLTSLRNKLYIGKILIDGTYATLFGNGYELLLETIKKFDHKNPTSLIKNSNIYCNFFDDNEELVCARSPHITMGNLYVAKNKNISEYDKYFNLSKEIVCVNAIGENIQQRLNGCDYDSDTMLITNNRLILSNAKLHYERFLVPVFVGESSKKSGELWEVDYDIQKNMVGQIVNLSQIYNSIIWTEINKSNNDVTELYNKVAILAVMSGMEIDKAKRHYDISVECILEELNLYKKDLTNDFYPYFFQKISELSKKKYKNQQNKRQYAAYKTAMDFLYNKVIDTTLSNDNRTSDIPLCEISNRCEPCGGNSTKQATRILEYAKETIESINIVRAEHGNNEYDDNVYQRKVRAILNRGLSKIHSELNNEYTIHLILKKLDTEEFSDCLWAILYFVLKKNPDMFEKVFKTEKINYKLIPSQSDFDLKLYSKKYKKHQ